MDGRRDNHAELPVDPDTDTDLDTAALPARLRPGALLLVLIGGMAGTLARYGLSRAAPTRTGDWPWGTFAANLIGAFVLGLLLETLSRRGPDTGARQRWRLLAGTGFCGALTTFSSLAVEADLLVRSHDPALAVGYLAASLAAGCALTGAGIALASRPPG